MEPNVTIFSQKQHLYETIFDEDENGRTINIYEFSDCLATGIDLYYPNVLLQHQEQQFILPVLERTMSLNMGTVYEKSGMHYISDVSPPFLLESSPVFFFVYNTDNYFHFLYDTLPYLISFLKLKREIPEIKLLVQYPNKQKNELYRFVTEFLELLDISNSDMIFIGDNTIYKNIYVSNSYTHDFDSNLPPRKEIFEFYKGFVNQLHYRKSRNLPQKIYISRRTHLNPDTSNIGTNYTTRRRLVNEDEIVEKLEKHGFVEVFTENLSSVEKIHLFSNATHVIGAIGGGISNVVFSPKNTKLEVLVSPTFLDVNGRFKYSLDVVDTIYNTNTRHVELGEFKLFMRVKTKDEKIMGEIIKISGNKIGVSYTDGSVTGWNLQNQFQQIVVNKNDVEKLDNGLNCQWIIDGLMSV